MAVIEEVCVSRLASPQVTSILCFMNLYAARLGLFQLSASKTPRLVFCIV